MGHVRTGFLPRTAQWNAIVHQLSLFGGDASVVPIIADGTLSAIKKIYEVMPFDESIIKAISYLVNLAFSAKQTDQITYLNSQGYLVDKNLSTFSLVASAQRLITTENGSLEINKIAEDAAMQAVIAYQEKHQTNQLGLFGSETQSPSSSIGNGAAFCELARSFFAAFTDRQIKYYVDRVAASTINNYGELEKFTSFLSEQSNAIADHAFETSKIMQSFAAGWFNKYADNSLPSDKEIMDFLRISFGKMREEFRREADGK
jgi:hypothetical protein